MTARVIQAKDTVANLTEHTEELATVTHAMPKIEKPEAMAVLSASRVRSLREESSAGSTRTRYLRASALAQLLCH